MVVEFVCDKIYDQMIDVYQKRHSVFKKTFKGRYYVIIFRLASITVSNDIKFFQARSANVGKSIWFLLR